MGTIWTVESAKKQPLPASVKRYAIGDGLVLSVHPSGRMLWERSARKSGNLVWLRFGVAENPKDPRDPEIISESKARVLNEEYLERKRQKVDFVHSTNESATYKEVCRLYLESKKPTIEEATQKNYRDCLNYLKAFNDVKWSYFSEAMVVKEFKRLIETKGRFSAKTAGNVFDNLKRLCSWTCNPLNNVPRKMLFENQTIGDLNLGIIETEHYPSVTNQSEYLELYRYIKRTWDEEKRISQAALLVLSHFPKRPKEVMNLKWEHIDFGSKWIVWPKDHEKIKFSYRRKYPISDWLFEFLKNLYDYRTDDVYVFSVRRRMPMTVSALSMELRKKYNGIHCPHGFRASFESITFELGYDKFCVDYVLGHVHKDPNKGAYLRINGDTRLDKRRETMNDWSKWLEQ